MMKMLNSCLKVLQISLLIMMAVASVGINAKNLEELNPFFTTMDRAPSSYVADEELDTAPVKQVVWVKRVFVEDDAGVLVGMRRQIASWEKRDEFAHLWHLKSTGLYNTPDMEFRTKFVKKSLLRYVDKRISGEIRHAKKGSSWAKVGEVQKALKPNTTVKMNKYFKLKIKGKVLTGKITFELRNPFFKFDTYVWINGQAEVHTAKNFKKIGLATQLNYKVNEGRWIASVDQKITEHIGARLSAERKGFISLYDDKATQVFTLYFHHPF